jgi:hypothetical protein
VPTMETSVSICIHPSIRTALDLRPPPTGFRRYLLYSALSSTAWRLNTLSTSSLYSLRQLRTSAPQSQRTQQNMLQSASSKKGGCQHTTVRLLLCGTALSTPWWYGTTVGTRTRHAGLLVFECRCTVQPRRSAIYVGNNAAIQAS